MRRREFFGWLLSLSGAATAVGVFGVFYKGLLSHTMQRRPVARMGTSRPLPARQVWATEKMIINRRSKIVHWPHRALFTVRYRVARENLETLEVERWAVRVNAETGLHFDKSKSGTILEQLALRKIKYQADDKLSFNPDSLKESINVLITALREPYRLRSWRLLELLGRLICLQREADPERARRELIEKLKTLKFSYERGLREPLSWITYSKKFNGWHQKTVDRKYSRFRKKLASRIDFARSLA